MLYLLRADSPLEYRGMQRPHLVYLALESLAPESELFRQVELPLQCRQMRSPAHSLWNGVRHFRQGRSLLSRARTSCLGSLAIDFTPVGRARRVRAGFHIGPIPIDETEMHASPRAMRALGLP